MSNLTVMMTLGQFNFELNTAVYQELKRTTDYRWPKQDRFGQAAARQFVGIGDDTITLPGVIFPAWRGGRGQVEAMREMAADGQPLLMVAGDGVVMGRWVIERIEDGQTVFGPAGAALKQEFTLALVKYDDLVPDDLALDDFALDLGAALAGPAAAAAAAADKAASMAGTIASTLTNAAATIQGLAAQVTQSVQPAIDAVRQGMTAAANLKAAAVETKALVKRLGSINSLADAEGALGSLMRVASSTSAVAASASTMLGSSAASLVAGAEIPAAAAAVKGAMVTMNKMVVGVTGIRKQTDSILNGFK